MMNDDDNDNDDDSDDFSINQSINHAYLACRVYRDPGEGSEMKELFEQALPSSTYLI